MTISHIIVLIVRVLAVCLGIVSLNTMVGYFSFLASLDQISPLSIAVVIAPLIAAVLIWLFPVSVARALTGYRGSELQVDTDKSLTADKFLRIALLILALYLAFNVISDAVYWVTVMLVKDPEGYDVGLSRDQVASIVATIVELLVLLVLILGRRQIMNLVRFMRQ